MMSMDEDAWCLGHYLPLPTCSVTGCHRPALRIGCRKEYGDGDLCREHQYETPAMREQIMEQDAMLVVRSSHYGHADF